MTEHAVIVELIYGLDSLDPLFELEDRLEKAILEAGAGEFDGDEIATDGSHARLYMYGPDADLLFSVVKPILESELQHEATATLQYGPPDENTLRKTVSIQPGTSD